MLTKIKFAPGIDKQDTAVGAEGRWVDSDNVRFRYGLPEKVGGWQSLLTDTMVGVARKQHAFVDKEGNRYVAIGTDKFLLLYFEGQLHDITPVKSTISSVVMSAADATKEVSLTFSSAHNLQSGDIILLDSVTVPSGIGLTDAAFEDKLFQVTRVTSSLVAIVTGTQTTTGAAGGGACSVIPYEPVGPAAQSYGYGFGIGQYGGTVQGSVSTTLNGSLNADTNGTGGSGTAVTVVSTTGFPTSGTIAIANELITYTSTNSTQFLGITRGAKGTATTGTSNGQAHSSSDPVTNATEFSGWGDAVDAGTITLEPGLWSLSNFGDVLVATIANGKTFTWNSDIAARLSTRASTTTRHLIHLGTETTIGTPSTQDNMFIRFSEDENINNYTPEATNTAGTQRIQDGTKIMGALVAKENILVWTDNALYTMKFVGAPFTFGFEQVGTNCGLIGKNACIEIDGVAYWMSNNGFFAFDGTVNSLPCSVEDYVFDDVDTTKGQQICAGLNNLFTEVVWWYPSAGSDFNNRSVAYNYGESKQPPLGTWYTNTNTNFNRTSWMDTLIYPRPYATRFNSTSSGTFPTVIGQTGLGQTVYFEHETGTDQLNPDGSTTKLTSYIKSFSFSLQASQSEVFLAMRRFLPNFKVLTGSNDVTVGVTDYPATDEIDSTYSPFTILPTTTHIDTRARGRYANLKLENTNAGETWRFGTFQVDIQPDGRR